MSKIGNNIAHLRKQRKWTQGELAQKLNIPRSTLSGYERAYAEPGIQSLVLLSEIFEVPLENLLTRKLWEGEHHTFQGEGMKVLAISVDSDKKANIELVEAKAEAGYTGSFDDPAFIKTLPKIYMPSLSEGTYRAFEIRGDSMLPMSESDIVICSYVESLEDIKDGKTYVVVTRDEGIVYKRLWNNPGTRRMILQSDNELFTPYELDYSQIAELWAYQAHISFQEPGEISQSLLDTRLEIMAQDLKEIKLGMRKK
nr:helix-turn-helix domain-containing protein [Saprospiraceae bacterium]